MLKTALTTLTIAAEAIEVDVSAITGPLLAPHRAIIIGRVGVGKTTLANRWCSTSHPTGLGGVTKTPVACDVGETVIVDTPGIDRPEQSIVDLGAVVSDADSLVWVLDGLQPLTASERQVVRALGAESMPVTLLVSRADLLEPIDVAQVLHRVHALTGTAATALDLRQDPLPDLPTGPTPSRRQQAATSLRLLCDGLSDAPMPLEAAQRSLRTRIQALVEQLRIEVHSGQLGHKVDALVALYERGPGVLVGLPPLPSPARPDQDRVTRLLGGLSGIEGAERLVRAGAASWLAEAQLALVDAYEAHPEWEHAARARAHFDGAAAQVLIALA